MRHECSVTDAVSLLLVQAVAAGGEDKAADLWRSSGLDASKFFEMPEDLEGLSAKYAFLAA